MDSVKTIIEYIGAADLASCLSKILISLKSLTDIYSLRRSPSLQPGLDPVQDQGGDGGRPRPAGAVQVPASPALSWTLPGGD